MAKILIIDDDFGWRSLYRLELGGAHQMLEAADPLEALEMIPRKRPDLILLDYHLPGMSGATLLAALRSRGVRIPVILCTAHPAQAPRDQCEAVVAKHTDLRRRRRTIEDVLAARHASDPGRAA
jgi:CheY-like chemotaxis protein